MPRIHKPKHCQNNGGYLKVCQKGEHPPGAGRPRKVLAELKGCGYSRDDIQNTLENILQLSFKEILEIADDKNNRPAIEVLLCRAMLKDAKKGKMEALNSILGRAHPLTQKVQLESKGETTIIKGSDLPIDPSEAARKYKQIMDGE